jgi:hypothetical protein
MRKTIPNGGNRLERLCEQVEGWRQSPSKSRAMPKELWDAAAAVAAELGAHRVAKALGVNSQRLRQEQAKRQGQSGGAEQMAGDLAPVQFVEVGRLAEIAPRCAEPVVVELVSPDGARLTIRTREVNASVLAVVSAFRGRA